MSSMTSLRQRQGRPAMSSPSSLTSQVFPEDKVFPNLQLTCLPHLEEDREDMFLISKDREDPDVFLIFPDIPDVFPVIPDVFPIIPDLPMSSPSSLMSSPIALSVFPNVPVFPNISNCLPQHPQMSSPTSRGRQGRHVFPNISGKDREDLTSPTSQGRQGRHDFPNISRKILKTCLP